MTTTNNPSGSPVLGGKPSRSTRFTNKQQPTTNYQLPCQIFRKYF
ncbi:MAG: hypothetical protein ACHBN1_22260 [Heteroscytonema crispum UTEX LB 1556]